MFNFFRRQKPSAADADKEQPSSSTASPLAPPRRKDDTARDKGREMGPVVKALPTGVKKKGDAMSSWSPWSLQGGVESPEEVHKRPVTHSQDPITRRTDVPTIVISSSCSPRTSPVRSTSSIGAEARRDDSTPGVKLEAHDSVVVSQVIPRPLSDSANVALTSVGKDERMDGDVGVVKLTAANVIRPSEAKEEVRKETFSKQSASTAGLVKSPLPAQPPAIFSQTGVVYSQPVTSVLPTTLPQPSVSSRTVTSNLQAAPESSKTYIKPTTFPQPPSIKPEEASQSSLPSQSTIPPQQIDYHPTVASRSTVSNQASNSSRPAVSPQSSIASQPVVYSQPTSSQPSIYSQPVLYSQSSMSSQLASSVQPGQPTYPLSSDNKTLNAWVSPTPVKEDAKSSKDTSEELIKRQEELQRLKETWELEKRSLVNQEEKFKQQLAELNDQLTASDTERNKLLYQMEELQRDVIVKNSGVDRLQAELTAAHKDSELVRKRMNRLEEDLNEFKQKNMELAEELVRKAEELQSDGNNEKRVAELESSLEEVQGKVNRLETELQSLQKDRDSLQKEREDMLAEREEEMKIVQEALEESQEEKMAIQARFEKDFERLRTVNTDREQQLLDDFEWKLREVEQACKRRLEEKDKVTEEKIREMKRAIEGKVKVAEKQLQETEQLKSYEAEVTQLRGLTHEQQRSLRVATRQTEQLQVSEKMLKEEISRLQSSLNKEKAHYSAMQTIHDRRMAELEKKLQARLDQQKSELTAFWEDRVRKECSRFKVELDHLHSEEKKLAVESMRSQKEQELKTAKLDWERRMQDSHKEIASLKECVVEKDSYYSNELERSQTNADRDILELRRKLDKLDLQYQEQIEKLVDKHEKEIDSLNEDAERKVQQLEQNWQLQMSSTRATLELVKEQMERDAQSRLEAAGEKHRNQLAMQWEQLLEEKEKALEVEVEKHRGQLDKVKQELEHAVKTRNIKESELLETIEQLRAQLDGQSTTISDLEGNVDLLEGGMQVLNQQITTQSHEMTKVQQQAAIRIRERDATWEAELRRRLAELATKHTGQQKQWQAQMCQMQEAAQKKINNLLQLLEESHQQCENCESHPDDTQLIADLRKIVYEKDRELASLTEEKRFYQMELVNRETNYNRLFNSQPVIGVMDALQHRRCKGSSEGCAPSNKANSKSITLVTSSYLPSPVSNSIVQRSHSMDLQEVVFSVPNDRCQSLDTSVSLPLPSANSTNNECSLQPDTEP